MNVIEQGFKDLSFLSNLYAVGGCVRDLIMCRKIKDVDFATNLPPNVVLAISESHGAKSVPTGIEHGTVTLNVEGRSYEVTTFRRDVSTDGRRAAVRFADTLEEDLHRRDFTMNAMAMDALGNIIDPHDGRRDIEQRRIQFVGSPTVRIQEDYLRIIRGCRFASRYEFDLTTPTWRSMKAGASRVLEAVSIERVTMEFEKAFQDPRPSWFLRLLFELGIVQQILPELENTDQLMQNLEYHPEGSVWHHILEVVDRAPPSHRWHALLHDVGKPSTAEHVNDNSVYDYYTFHGHEDAGADMISEICQRLRLPNTLRDSLKTVTRLHMYPLHASRNGAITERMRRRFQVQAGPYLKDLEILCRADAGESFTTAPNSEVRRPEDAWKLFEPLPKQIEPVLMGRHLIQAGLEPGPEFGARLRAAFEYQLNTGCQDLNKLLEIALNTS